MINKTILNFLIIIPLFSSILCSSIAHSTERKNKVLSASVDLLSISLAYQKRRSDNWFAGPSVGLGIGLKSIIFSTSEHFSNDHNIGKHDYERFFGEDSGTPSTSTDSLWLGYAGTYRKSKYVNVNVGVSSGMFSHLGLPPNDSEMSNFFPGVFFETYIMPEFGLRYLKIGTKLSLSYLHEASHSEFIEGRYQDQPSRKAVAVRWTPVIIRAVYEW